MGDRNPTKEDPPGPPLRQRQGITIPGWLVAVLGSGGLLGGVGGVGGILTFGYRLEQVEKDTAAMSAQLDDVADSLRESHAW